MIPGFRRLAGLYDDRTLPVDAPWDRALTEGAESWQRPKMHDPQHYDYRKARYDLTKSQGYADLSKSAKLKLDLKDAISMAMAALVVNPTSKTVYIKDPSGLLNADIIQKAAENWLTGKDSGSPSYGAFGFDNNDHEIYADGTEVFVHGEWGQHPEAAEPPARAARLHPARLRLDSGELLRRGLQGVGNLA